jgi:hypothetical protein
MTRAQHVWVGPETTRYEAECEACRYARDSIAFRHVPVEGSLRPDADVGFTTCRRGHRIVVRRIGRSLAVAATR